MVEYALISLVALTVLGAPAASRGQLARVFLPRSVLTYMRFTQRGQGMVEYALILALVALIVIIALIATGGQLMNVYSNISRTMCFYHVGC
jgi:Flp pilus assembly pilin Flp